MSEQELKEDFVKLLATGLISKTLNSCSRWATHRRIMGTPLEGPYSFKHHPWCEEIHDSLSVYNTTMKAAQMGMTEIAINRAFFTIDVLKKDVLYVLPTALNASDFAKSRFNTALSYSDYLSLLFTDTNTIGLKQAGGVNLYIRGSRGDSNLKSIPVSTLILDELDEMDEKQIYLAMERLSGHRQKSIWSISTPTVPKFSIHKMYLQGTQEHYMFKCPHCNRTTELIWPDCMEICGEAVNDPNVKRSFMRCNECKHKLTHELKYEWLSNDNASWVSTAYCNEDHRSFQINQLYSHAMTPGEIVIAHFRGVGDEAANVEFFNSKLGIPYIPDGGQVTDEDLDNLIGKHTKQDPRPTVGREKLICMGIDQGKMNHIVVVQFDPGMYGSASGSMDLNASYDATLLWEGKISASEFKNLDHYMVEWQVLACVIDADPQINDARRFARRFPGFVYLCRYRGGVTGKELQISEEDGGAPILTVDRTNWLDASLGRFHSDRVHLPIDISLEYREHIKNLVRTYVKDDMGNPRATYLNTGADHFAHAMNYAEMALQMASGVVDGADVTDKVI